MNTQKTALKREMSFLQLLVLGLIFIGPLAPVGIFGTLDSKSNGAVASVYIIATVAMSFTAFSYMQMSREVPRAGSVFAFATAGVGKKTGYVAGWMILLDYILVPSIAFLFTGFALNSLFPSLPIWLIVTVSIAIGTGLNLAGVTIASRVVTVAVALEIIALVIMLAASFWILAITGPTRGVFAPLTGMNGTTFTMILSAVSVAVLVFLGFDSLATFSEETKGGGKTVSKATMTCLIVAGLLFMVQSYVASLLSDISPTELQSHPELEGQAFYTALNVSIGPWAQWMIALVKTLGTTFAAMVGQASGARIMMDMAREGKLPRALAKVSNRRRVPYISIVLAATITIFMTLWAASRDDGLDQLSSIVNMGALSSFLLLHVSVIGYFLVKKANKVQGSVIKHGIIPVIGILISAIIVIEANALAQIIALIWAIVGIVIAIIQQSTKSHFFHH